MAYEIQVFANSRWTNWAREGGGDYVLFQTREAARNAALDTRELSWRDEDHTWRIAFVAE